MTRPLKTQSLPIAVAADENYLDGLAGTLGGVLRSASGARIHTVVLDCGIQDSTWATFQQVLQSRFTNLDLVRLPVDPTWLQPFSPETRVRNLNNSTYARLLLPELLPHLDRILYLDCDLLVDADLRLLFDTPLEGALVGATPEAHLPSLGQNVSANLLSPADASLPAFNSGVLLMDLAALRGANLVGPVTDLIPRMQSRLQSQAVMNYLLRGRWKPIPVRWNRQHFITENFSLYRDHPGSLWHFIGKMKPWHFDPRFMRGLIADFHRDIVSTGWIPRHRGDSRPLSSAWRDSLKAARAFSLRQRLPA